MYNPSALQVVKAEAETPKDAEGGSDAPWVYPGAPLTIFCSPNSFNELLGEETEETPGLTDSEEETEDESPP